MPGESAGELVALEREVKRLGQVERRMQALLAVITELAAARSVEDVGRIAVERGIAAVGASYGGIWTIDRAASVLRLLAASPLPRGSIDRWAVVPLDVDAPLPHVARSGAPLFLRSLGEFEARFPGSFERIRETISSPDAAYASLPCAAEGEPLAALALTFERGSDFDSTEETYLTILARQCGLALDRIHLLEAERTSRQAIEAAAVAAEEATRAREEILSVVSHDLRNPLGTILMGASTLLHANQAGDPSDPKAQRVHAVANRILRQSERMARLIDDLVDFAGIQAGRLRLRRELHEPASILASVRELFGPLADERQLQLVIEERADLPKVDCDAERAVQLVANLAANALKVTGRGGTITIGARLGDDGTTVFYVRDTGPGIDDDELPHLFERFWRSKKSAYKGAGLGLSIARGIVEAHGGRIWVESRTGVGTTFSFSLARQPAGDHRPKTATTGPQTGLQS